MAWSFAILAILAASFAMADSSVQGAGGSALKALHSSLAFFEVAANDSVGQRSDSAFRCQISRCPMSKCPTSRCRTSRCLPSRCRTSRCLMSRCPMLRPFARKVQVATAVMCAECNLCHQVPDIKVPDIKAKMPEVKLPEVGGRQERRGNLASQVKLPEKKEEVKPKAHPSLLCTLHLTPSCIR